MRLILAAAVVCQAGWTGAVELDVNTTSVAVIGGGIAGAATVLELLSLGHQDITLYEYSDSLRTSTSSNIAATSNFDTLYRPYMPVQKSLKDAWWFFRTGYKQVSGLKAKERWFEFTMHAVMNIGLGYAKRSSDVQSRKVYRSSHAEFIKVLQRFPSICKASVGYFCCQAGGQAKVTIEAQNYTCPSSPYSTEGNPFGVYQLASTAKDCAKFEAAAVKGIDTCDDKEYKSESKCVKAGHVWQQINLTYYGADATRMRVEGYLQDDTSILCSLVEHRLTGFYRSERLFAVFAELFAAAPQVRVLTSCGVSELAPLTDGRVEVRAVDGCSKPTQIYHKLAVAASVGSIPLLRKVDPHLDRHLIPIKGYGVAGVPGDKSPVVDADESGRAFHFIEHGHHTRAAYGRTVESHRVKIWGGHVVDMNEKGLYPMAQCPSKLENKIFKQGPPIARDLVELKTTIKTTGVRPIASVGQVPILKRYEGAWSNVFLNTGYGYNGYDLAWLSSRCIAEWMVYDEFRTAVCAEATAIGPEKTTWIGWYFILLVMALCIFVALCACVCCYPVCYCCTKRYPETCGCAKCLGRTFPCCWQPTPPEARDTSSKYSIGGGTIASSQL